jgi:hypothetical protein
VQHSLLLSSGISALSEKTMISAGPEHCYAMSSAACDAAIEEGLIQEAYPSEPGSVIVERWRYAPALASINNDSVDNLSLFLSMHNSPDERIQGALRNMLEDMPW